MYWRINLFMITVCCFCKQYACDSYHHPAGNRDLKIKGDHHVRHSLQSCSLRKQPHNSTCPYSEDRRTANMLQTRAKRSAKRKKLRKRHSRRSANREPKLIPLYNSTMSFDANSRVLFEENVEHYVELLVVADSIMKDFHGSDLNRYINVLTSIVASIYNNYTIGDNINIVLKNVMVLDSPEIGPKISENAAGTLANFCQWQYRIFGNNGHDIALLLTRNNLCRSPGKCDTLGLAEVGTLCDPVRSCAIAEDNGLSTAFTIAHELGHLFNLPHDNEARCKKYKAPDDTFEHHMMSSTLDYLNHPWAWSTCSTIELTKYLASGGGLCLKNKPRLVRYLQSSQAKFAHQPGVLYSLDEQCTHTFGHGSRRCPYSYNLHNESETEDVLCKRLWCTSPDNDANHACRTQHMPWADGTSCGHGRWCKKGMCRRKAELLPVDGGWGGWQPFDRCSRSCGGGIQLSTRICDSPHPQNGGKRCPGYRTRYRSCNVQECEDGSDFRAQQCHRFDGNNFHIAGVPRDIQWVPKYLEVDFESKCKLMCQVPSNPALYFTLASLVVDGTKCHPGSTDLCVNGQCVPAGCDNIIGSTKRRDMCGVCGGDGSLCEVVSGAYFDHSAQRYGYHHVATINKGELIYFVLLNFL